MENIIVSLTYFYFKPIVGLLILAGVLIYFILKKKFPSQKFLFYCLVIFSLILIFRSFLLSFLNWYFWSQKEITRYLLPPYNPISYVFQYSWYHYFFEAVVALIFGWLIFFFIKLFNKKFEGSLFYEEEKYLAALGILATGWPNALIFLALVLFSGVLFHFINYFLNGFAHLLSRSYRSSAELGSAVKTDRQNEMQRLRAAGARRPRSCEISEQIRLSLLPFWLPCALIVLITGDIISKYMGITQLSI